MITVTGVTGHLGRLAIEHLLTRGVPAAELSGLARDPGRAAELAGRGVSIRQGDYDRPDGLPAAFEGTDTLLLVSASEVGKRLAQHAAIINAARAAGVRKVVYTSLLAADTSKIGLAEEHVGTEQLIRESGLPFVFLRNGWYLENYTEHLAPDLEHGVHLGSAGSGRVAAAARTDYAEAAAIVLTTRGHEGATYELAGDTAFDYTQLAAEITKVSGTTVTYRDLGGAEHLRALTDAGVPQQFAESMVDWDAGVARGDLDSDRSDLHRLIGRSTTTLTHAITEALRLPPARPRPKLSRPPVVRPRPHPAGRGRGRAHGRRRTTVTGQPVAGVQTRSRSARTAGPRPQQDRPVWPDSAAGQTQSRADHGPDAGRRSRS